MTKRYEMAAFISVIAENAEEARDVADEVARRAGESTLANDVYAYVAIEDGPAEEVEE